MNTIMSVFAKDKKNQFNSQNPSKTQGILRELRFYQYVVRIGVQTIKKALAVENFIKSRCWFCFDQKISKHIRYTR